jgi:hypothetical protein
MWSATPAASARDVRQTIVNSLGQRHVASTQRGDENSDRANATTARRSPAPAERRT